MYCKKCHENRVPKARKALGYSTCLTCGEKDARRIKHTVVPMNKSNYIVVTDLNILKQLNPKRGI